MQLRSNAAKYINFFFKGRDESSTHLTGPFEEQMRCNACESPAWQSRLSMNTVSWKEKWQNQHEHWGPEVSWGHCAPSRHGCPGNVPQFCTSTPANKDGFFDTCALSSILKKKKKEESKIKDICYINRKIIGKNYGSSTFKSMEYPCYTMRNLSWILLEKGLEHHTKVFMIISKIEH